MKDLLKRMLDETVGERPAVYAALREFFAT